MRRRDQRRAIVTAGNLLRARAELQQQLERRHVIGDGGYRHRVVAVAFFGIEIGAGFRQRRNGVAMTAEGGDMQGRAAVSIPRVDIRTAGGQAADLARVAARSRTQQAGIGRDFARAGRDLRGRCTGQSAGNDRRRDAAASHIRLHLHVNFKTFNPSSSRDLLHTSSINDV
jgi:hypothetical protein